MNSIWEKLNITYCPHIGTITGHVRKYTRSIITGLWNKKGGKSDKQKSVIFQEAYFTNSIGLAVN